MIEYKHLIGRRFDLGRHDCFDLFASFYRDNYGIEITNYARPKDWNADTLDIIGATYLREGFFKLPDWRVETLTPGDTLCMAIGTSVANHLAIYVGDNTIIHHLTGKMSSEELLRPFWKKATCYVIRHPDVPVIKKELPVTDLMRIIHERYKVNPA